MASVDDQPRNQLGEWTEKPCSAQPEAFGSESWFYPESDLDTAEKVIGFWGGVKIPDWSLDRLRDDYKVESAEWAKANRSLPEDKFEDWYISKYPRPIEPTQQYKLFGGETDEYLAWKKDDALWERRFESAVKHNAAIRKKNVGPRPKIIRNAYILNVARCVGMDAWADKLPDAQRAKVLDYRVPVSINGSKDSTVGEVLASYYPEGTGRAFDSLVNGRESAQISELRKQVTELREQLIENTRNSAYTNELLEKLVNNSAITARQLAALNKTNANALDIARATQQTIDMDSYAAAKARAKRR